MVGIGQLKNIFVFNNLFFQANHALDIQTPPKRRYLDPPKHTEKKHLQKTVVFGRMVGGFNAYIFSGDFNPWGCHTWRRVKR